MPCRSLFFGKQSIRYAEAKPARGDDEHLMMRAQILRHQRHRRAVAAVARHHHQLPDPGSRDAFADRHPFLQCDVGRQRLRAGIIDMLGGNADRLYGQESDRKCCRQQLAHARQIGLADQDVGFQRQMRAVLFGRRQRQHRDPARGVGVWRCRASGSRSSRGAERLKASSEAFLWMNLQGSLLDIPGT